MQVTSVVLSLHPRKGSACCGLWGGGGTGQRCQALAIKSALLLDTEGYLG